MQSRRIIIHCISRILYAISSIPPEAAHIPDVHTECCAYPLQHVHPHRVILDQLLVRALRNLGKLDDIAGAVAATIKEEP